MRRVVLLDFPVRLLDRARKQRESLIREFAFLVHGGETEGVPARLLEIAAESDAHYAHLNPGAEEYCDDALARGEEFVDIEVYVPDDFRDHINRAIPVLLEVEQYCREGQMLTLMTPPDLRRFWTWYLGEFVRQIDGLAPTPWREWGVRSA
jgi:hypothetical protein